MINLHANTVIKRLYVSADHTMLLTMSTAWNFYQKYIEKLQPFNNVYTKEYGDEQKQAIKIAINYKNINELRESSIILRNKMTKAGKACTRNFKVAKRYIYHLGYDGSILKQHYTQAGQPYFAKATNQNWESMEKMNACVLNYLDENRLKLMQKGNMPAGFIDKVKREATVFEDLLRSFEKERKITDTVEVIIAAYNAIFKTGMNMLIDAQLALEGTVLESIFSYNRLLKSVSRKRKRTTGVVKTADNVRVPYAKIIVEQDGEEVKTIRANKKGEFKACDIGKGMKLRIVAKGMVTEVIEATSEEKKHLDIVMRAA